MTFFSRCDASQVFEPSLRLGTPRSARTKGIAGRVLNALSGFAEDLGILVRYAVGLDYYDRSGLSR